MNISPELLETRRHHIAKAIEASHALESGHITADECASVVNMAADWCGFVHHLHNDGLERGPLASLLSLLLELATDASQDT